MLNILFGNFVPKLSLVLICIITLISIIIYIFDFFIYIIIHLLKYYKSHHIMLINYTKLLKQFSMLICSLARLDCGLIESIK